MPEIDEIEGSIRGKTRRAFLNHCPEYFWFVPASSSGNHHPKDTRGLHGLWLHVRRTFQVYDRVARSYLEQEKINRWELNCGRAAILLHDICKYGMLEDWQQQRLIESLTESGELPEQDWAHTVSEHDVIAAEYLDEHTDLPDDVIRCIDTHNGAWYAGDTPSRPLEQVHHLADMITSEPAMFVVLDDHPLELEEVSLLDPKRLLEKD